ncbi:MAG: hypoxanthine phosphoribosyltransferase [Desulfovibrionaceae bacterium]
MINTSLELKFSQIEILEKVETMAMQINNAYQGKPLVVICVLKGAFMFFSDLTKCLKCSPVVDFIKISSYGNSMVRKEGTCISKDIEIDVNDRHVLIVEDIVDTGHSMQFLLQHLSEKGAVSVKVATLLNKTELREVPVSVDFSCFTFSSGFLVGYGLDYAEKYRELPAIYTLKETKLK